MRLITDIFAYCREHVPKWNTISISGYHIREAGSTAVQEIAFTLANGIAYVQAAIDAGLDVDEFAPRLSFFWNAHNNFFEEVAKFRAARRMWYRIMTERFGAKKESSKLLRFHTQTGGVDAHRAAAREQHRARRRCRRWRRCSAARRACTPTASTRRSACRPSGRRTIALRTQQIIGYESGVVDTPDPLAGSYFVESLTDEVEARAWEYIERIDEMGGAVAAIEAGYQQDEIEQAAYEYTKSIDDGERVIVGVNRFTDRRRARARGLPDRPGAAARPGRAAAGAAGPTRDQAAVDGRARGRARRPPAARRTCCRRCRRRSPPRDARRGQRRPARRCSASTAPR